MHEAKIVLRNTAKYHRQRTKTETNMAAYSYLLAATQRTREALMFECSMIVRLSTPNLIIE